jgi:hypothetical protein
MSLAPGTLLGPYEILGPLGAGGMGEVYRARDTRLSRDVAIKVLAPHCSTSPEVRARLRREAQTISSLNHPHICTLHDVGREGDTDYLVMELVEGETLAQRLARGRLPTTEVPKLGLQIAGALDSAHRAGVIHRDLKPGNVMLTKSGVKLMDFGLARVTGPAAASGVEVGAAASQSPTESRPLTAEGTIVGTFQYMAPEQLEGKEADARSDLWALGCVLYEMATGKPAFEGQSQASLIAAIMEREPPAVTQLAPMAPPALEHLVKQCLSKDRCERWQTAGDLKRELQWIAEAGSDAGESIRVGARSPASWRRLPSWGVATLAVALLVAGGLAGAPLIRRPTQAGPPLLLSQSIDARMLFEALSPDGTRLACVRESAGHWLLTVLDLREAGRRDYPEVTNLSAMFWSPDGREVALFTRNGLEGVNVNTGIGRRIASFKSGPRSSGAWSTKGVILVTNDGRLFRVRSSGGNLEQIAVPDSAGNEGGFRNPHFLPDGRRFLIARSRDTNGLGPTLGIDLASLDSRRRSRGARSNSLLTGAGRCALTGRLPRPEAARNRSPPPLGGRSRPCRPIRPGRGRVPGFHRRGFLPRRRGRQRSAASRVPGVTR